MSDSLISERKFLNQKVFSEVVRKYMLVKKVYKSKVFQELKFIVTLATWNKFPA